MLKNEETIAELVKVARKEKKISARKLASLVGVSHTEINNIESGFRVKPSILVLKGFEKYLDIPFNRNAILHGYSKKFGNEVNCLRWFSVLFNTMEITQKIVEPEKEVR